jgi:hypothetical protein
LRGQVKRLGIIDREERVVLRGMYGVAEEGGVGRRMMHDECVRTGLRLEELVGEKRGMDRERDWDWGGKEDGYSEGLEEMKKRLGRYGGWLGTLGVFIDLTGKSDYEIRD